MILSASRRTDIPAFYGDWFFNRVRAGFVDAVNPFNRKQVSRIELSPDAVDCIVFWTKNAAPILSRLDELGAYKFYFQYTITAYGRDVEPGLCDKKIVIETFKELSQKIGRDFVIWRYDPIFLSELYSAAWHEASFARLASELAPFTQRVVISFIDFYRKTERNMKQLCAREFTADEMYSLAKKLKKIAASHELEIQSCSEEIELESLGIAHGACIDKDIVEKLMGAGIDLKKDKNKRKECGCMESADIGCYNTCRHLCRYCYANFNERLALSHANAHDPNATILAGKLLGDEKITRKKPVSQSLRSLIEETTLF